MAGPHSENWTNEELVSLRERIGGEVVGNREKPPLEFSEH
jgi:hypothetical protein